MSIFDEKYKKILNELIENNCIELDHGIYIIHHYDSIEYLSEQLHEEYHEYFKVNVTPMDIIELINAYRESIALSTSMVDEIIKENKELKQQLKYKHGLNGCLMHVIEVGGVKED